MREEKPLQVIGAINAYHARLATAAGFKAIYLSGGGVAAGSLVATQAEHEVPEGAVTANDTCGRPLQ